MAHLAFVNIAEKYKDVSLQSTLDLQKLRSFIIKIKPVGKLIIIPPITSCFVKEQINSMSTSKAVGLDIVAVSEIANFLTGIINLSFETATRTSVRLLSVLSSIFKPGDKSAQPHFLLL